MENNKNMEEESFFEEIGKIFLIILIIGSIFEIGILVFAYVNTDEVECNLLWCTFTSSDSYKSHESYKITSSNTISNRECFVNGEEINCSEIANKINWEDSPKP